MYTYDIYTDGGSRGNPGPAGSGIIIYRQPGRKQVWRASIWLGDDKTNNYAEYMAICRALEACLKYGYRNVRILTDSKLALEQLEGNWKVKDDGLKVLHARATDARVQMDSVELVKVKGHSGDPGNDKADELANKAMDDRKTKIVKKKVKKVETSQVEQVETVKKKKKKKKSKKKPKVQQGAWGAIDRTLLDQAVDDLPMEALSLSETSGVKGVVAGAQDSVHDMLQKVFKFPSFRPGQEDIVNTASFTSKDVLAIMPTGAGKSLCFHLPAVIGARDGKSTLVVSPLRSLIKDQVDQLTQTWGLGVALVTGERSMDENQRALEQIGQWTMLYITPEILSANEDLLLRKRDRIARLVIDEAHCLSNWGHDFRPAYRYLERFRKVLPNVPITALTATATPKVREDIERSLAMKDVQVFQSSYFRPNLKLHVEERGPASKFRRRLLQILEHHRGTTGIIYCMSRKRCNELAQFVSGHGYKAAPYHAGMTTKQRHKTQDHWQHDKIDMVCATIAFGMGIDKKDTRWIVHSNLPKTMMDYYQEIGRAGRDGLDADCYLLYSYGDKIVSQKMIQGFGNEAKEKTAGFLAHQFEALHKMTYYAMSKTSCRHRQVCDALGETMKTPCGTSCDVCLHAHELVPIDVTAQANLVFQKLQERAYSRSQLLKQLPGVEEAVVMHLILEKYLKEVVVPNQNGFWYQQLQMYRKCTKIMDGRKTLVMNKVVESNAKAVKKQAVRAVLEGNPTLVAELKTFRSAKAKELGKPAYVVFPNKVIEGIASLKPLDLAGLKAIKGVGPKTLNAYGKELVDLVRRFM